MKKSEIQVGKRYVNKHGARTTRTVIAIGPEVKGQNEPYWWGQKDRPQDPVVTFSTTNRQWKGREHHQYLCTFLAWAGREVG